MKLPARLSPKATLVLACLLGLAAPAAAGRCQANFHIARILALDYCCPDGAPGYDGCTPAPRGYGTDGGYANEACDIGPCGGHGECYKNGQCCYNGSCTDILDLKPYKTRAKCPGVPDEARCRAYIRRTCVTRSTEEGMNSCIIGAGNGYAAVYAEEEKKKADDAAKAKADADAAAEAEKKKKEPPKPVYKGPPAKPAIALTNQEKAVQGALKERGTAKRATREDLVAGAKAYLATKAEDAKTTGKAAERLQPFERGYLAKHPGIPAAKTKIITALMDAADKEPKDKTPNSGALLSAGLRALMRRDLQAYADASDKTTVDEALPKWAAGLSEGMKLEDALKSLAAPAPDAITGGGADPFAKALDALFPGDDGKVPRAVVEYLAKDKAAKDEIVAAAAGTNQAAVKGKWSDAAVKKVGDHLAAPAADPGFASQLSSKGISDKDLTDYYCPRRPAPVPGKPAMAQLKAADAQGANAVKSGTTEGAAAGANLTAADTLQAKCAGTKSPSPVGTPTETFQPTKPNLAVKEPPKPGDSAKEGEKPAAQADPAKPKDEVAHAKFVDKNFERMVAGVAGGIVGGAAAAALLPALGPVGIILGAVIVAAIFLFVLG